MQEKSDFILLESYKKNPTLVHVRMLNFSVFGDLEISIDDTKAVLNLRKY